MEQVATVGDDDIIFVLKHGVGEKLSVANVLTAEITDRAAIDVESQKTRTMIVGISDT